MFVGFIFFKVYVSIIQMLCVILVEARTDPDPDMIYCRTRLDPDPNYFNSGPLKRKPF